MSERSQSNGNIDRSVSKPLARKLVLMMSIYKSWTDGKIIEVVSIEQRLKEKS